MVKKELHVLVAEQKILNKIYAIRDEKMMLDLDLAEMYGVETKQLKRQVKRNIARFPKDFMFELSVKEFENLRSQIGTSRWGGTRFMPMAFTELGVAMLSSIDIRSVMSIQFFIIIESILLFLNRSGA